LTLAAAVVGCVAGSGGTVASAESAETARNPFALPKGVYAKALTPKPEPAIDLILQAVIAVDKNKRSAIINKQNVQLGDHISGREVIEIGEAHAVLRDAKGQVTLKLKEPQFSVRHSEGY
jgi:hypothetical protein